MKKSGELLAAKQSVPTEPTSRWGTVYIVGAGPGDEDLFTLKGARCLAGADTIVYDHLTSESLLTFSPEGCEKIYVGKESFRHTMSQAEINKLLVSKAKEGKTVVRLKGGDPFVFGRGGEEALALAESGIPFEVVPGVTAAVAALACAGIPITHRGLASTAMLITGHEMPGKTESDIDWKTISAVVGTIVFYMGVKNLPVIVKKLVENGKPSVTPAVVVQWGTLNKQRTVTGTLDTIAGEAERAGITPPAIIAVGEVISLRKKLRWFDIKPLFGKRIVVTRSRSQAPGLSRELKRLGADIVEFPTIDIVRLKDLNRLDGAIDRIKSFTWIVFTSVNGVAIFFERLFEKKLDSRSLAGIKVAAIGPETGIRLQSLGIKPDLIPETFTSEGVVEVFNSLKPDYSGERILIPGSAIGRDVIPVELKRMGADVKVVSVYENRVPEYSREEIDAVFKKPPDLVTFTSASTVSNLAALLKKSGKDKYISRLRGASIGPATSQSARRNNIEIETEAETHTIRGLVQAILKYFTLKE
ncbi:MAG: uroporphyrinogen-III C-methyltransferase [Spirochaetota bacterium]